MPDLAECTILVVTDKSFPRDTDGRPDATRFAEYRLNTGLTEAHVLLVADGYPAPGMRDDLLIAIAHDLGWGIAYLNTTRSHGNEYSRTFDWWMGRTSLAIGQIVFYGRGFWDERHTI